MKRNTEGTIIVVSTVLGIAIILAMAVAWGPDNECAPQFPEVIGCAFASYEGLSGVADMLAAECAKVGQGPGGGPLSRLSGEPRATKKN